jgi:hypothetical protein
VAFRKSAGWAGQRGGAIRIVQYASPTRAPASPGSHWRAYRRRTITSDRCQTLSTKLQWLIDVASASTLPSTISSAHCCHS